MELNRKESTGFVVRRNKMSTFKGVLSINVRKFYGGECRWCNTIFRNVPFQNMDKMIILRTL